MSREDRIKEAKQKLLQQEEDRIKEIERKEQELKRKRQLMIDKRDKLIEEGVATYCKGANVLVVGKYFSNTFMESAYHDVVIKINGHEKMVHIDTLDFIK